MEVAKVNNSIAGINNLPVSSFSNPHLSNNSGVRGMGVSN
jgi:hypothetical protein